MVILFSFTMCFLFHSTLFSMDNHKRINDLPDDIIFYEVFPYLPREELMKMGLISVRYNSLLKKWGEENKDEWLKRCILSIDKLKEEDANKHSYALYLNSRDWVTEETLDVLRVMCPKLKILEICDLPCETYEKMQVHSDKIIKFAEEHKCGVCYGKRGHGDMWFIASEDGGQPQINHPPVQTEFGEIRFVPEFQVKASLSTNDSVWETDQET